MDVNNLDNVVLILRRGLSRNGTRFQLFSDHNIAPYVRLGLHAVVGYLSPRAAFGGFLPILYGGDDRQRSNSGGLPLRMRL